MQCKFLLKNMCKRNLWFKMYCIPAVPWIKQTRRFTQYVITKTAFLLVFLPSKWGIAAVSQPPRSKLLSSNPQFSENVAKAAGSGRFRAHRQCLGGWGAAGSVWSEWNDLMFQSRPRPQGMEWYGLLIDTRSTASLSRTLTLLSVSHCFCFSCLSLRLSHTHTLQSLC